MIFPPIDDICDCHSHVFGPFARFPLSPKRTFDPPEAAIEQLSDVWKSLGIQRAVLVQGSAHGSDHGALLEAILQSPQTRRGVALLDSSVTDEAIAGLHRGGIRAVRFNWIRHLLRNDSRSESQRLVEAEELLARISPLGWHVEFHIDMDDLDFVTRLKAPEGMRVVVDHMARLDLSLPTAQRQVEHLLRVLDNDLIWVKLSGVDRLAVNCEDLRVAIDPMRKILDAVPERCVWGLDWPHVNLLRKRSNDELAEVLIRIAEDEGTLKLVLVQNPAILYGFNAVTN